MSVKVVRSDCFVNTNCNHCGGNAVKIRQRGKVSNLVIVSKVTIADTVTLDATKDKLYENNIRLV